MKMHENNKKCNANEAKQKNAQKKSKLQQGGGAVSSQGVQEQNKSGTGPRGQAGAGSVQPWIGPRRTEPIGEYIWVVNPILPSFPKHFLSLLSHNRQKLSPSLCFLSTSPVEVRWRRCGGRRAIAAEPPRRSLKALFFCFFVFVLSLLLLPLYTFLTLKSPNANPKFLDLQKNETKERRCYLYVLFGRWRAIHLPFSSLLGSNVCVSGCESRVRDYAVGLCCTIRVGVMNALFVCTGIDLSRGSDVLNELWLCRIFAIFSSPLTVCRYSFYSEGLVFRVCWIQVTCAWNLGCRCEVAWIGDQDEGLFLEICS